MNKLMRKGRAAAGILESSVALSASPQEAAELKNTIAQGSHPIKRLIARGMVTAALTAPRTTARLIGRPLPPGMSYAGAGWHSVAYRDGDEVVKVNKSSVHMTEDERQELATYESKRHGVMEAYLGSVTVPQTVTVAPHPAVPSARAVQIRQRYYSYEDLGDVFPFGSDHINHDALLHVLHENPLLDEAFFTLARGGLAMAHETSLAPDIIRRGNLGVTPEVDSRLIIVDGQPVDAADPGATEYILPQLDDLSRFLDPVHA